MAAEAVTDRLGSGLTNVTRDQAVVLDTELHVWLDRGPWKRIMREMVMAKQQEGEQGVKEGGREGRENQERDERGGKSREEVEGGERREEGWERGKEGREGDWMDE